MWGALADAVVFVHGAFLVFLVAGGFLAWRWGRVLWAHLAAALWSLGIVTIGQPCPLTLLEHTLRARAGQVVPDRSFLAERVEGVIFPGAATPWLRLAAAVLVLTSYAVLVSRALAARRRLVPA